MEPQKKEKLYCPIRKEWIIALPEEQIRVGVVHHLVDQLGYPENLIVVEKGIDQLPHLNCALGLPSRRIDILVYGMDNGELKPLLLVECKAVPLTDRVVTQVLGYNHHIGAPYVSVVNDKEVRTGWYDQDSNSHRFIQRFPHYTEFSG